MKKGFLIIFLLIFSLSLYGKNFFVKMGGGFINSIAKFPDNWESEIKYLSFSPYMNKSNRCYSINANIEFTYKFSPYMGLIFGYEYSYPLGNFKGNGIEIHPLENIKNETFFISPSFRTELRNLYLCGALYAPIPKIGYLKLRGGIGYYFGELKSSTTSDYSPKEHISDWRHGNYHFNGKDSALGFQGGVGLDIKLFFENMYLSLDIIYNRFCFKNIRTNRIGEILLPIDYEMKPKTFAYIEFYNINVKENNIPILLQKFYYRISQITYNNFALQIGLKFEF